MIGDVQVSIRGVNLPGRLFCRPDGSMMDNVHVGVQIRRAPEQLVKADSSEARWHIDVDVVESAGEFDFRGPVVHGNRGERFLYLTWGNVGLNNEFEMFRRAKLMLNRVDPDIIRSAVDAGQLHARVDLTGGDGGPRCARVDAPAIEWSAPHVGTATRNFAARPAPRRRSVPARLPRSGGGDDRH
jgi:hypothetical protein